MESQELNQKSEENQSRRVAVVPVSVALLEHLLPMGSKILGVSQNDYSHTVNVLIAHDSFDEVPFGELPPTKTLMVYKSPYPVVSKVEYAS